MSKEMYKVKLLKYGLGWFICFVFMLFIFNPLELYTSNVGEFHFRLNNIICVLFFGAVVVLATMCGILVMAPLKIAKIFVFGIALVDILFYVQYFLNGRMGLLDGTNRYSTTKVAINYVIWIAIIGIAIYIRSNIITHRIFVYFPYAITAMQFVACISLMINFKNIDDNEKWIFTNKDELVVSSQQNILVLVLDCFSNEVIPWLKQDYPESLECLNDFVYFDNANSVYEATFMSLAYVLTGMEYDTTCSYLDWGDNAWGSEYCENIYNSLHDKNYKVRIYSTDVLGARNQENIAEKIDNYEKVEFLYGNTNYLNLMQVFLRSSLYKYLPLGLKSYFYISDEMFNKNADVVYSKEYELPIRTNYDYYSALINEGLKLEDKDTNYFIMEHLRGLHPPYNIDENGVFVENGERISAARGCMLIVTEYIAQLKKLGVYDNSTIIIMSDHGNQGQCEGVQPIFFIKERNRRSQEMEVRSAPISFEDIMPTILYEAGILNGQKTIYDYENTEIRERRMYIRGYDENVKSVERSISGGVSSINVLYKYTYTKDEQDLIDQEKAKVYEEIVLSEYPN